MTGLNVKGNLSTIAIIAVALINLCSSQNTNQRATLYSGRDGAGQSLPATEVDYPDLQAQWFDNKAYSACVTGVWLFYDNVNYNQVSGTMEYVFGPDNYCVNFDNLGGRLTSIRFVGYPKDYKANTLTLFSGEYFQGSSEYTFVDLRNLALDKNASSLIVTGPKPWTLYALPDYQGASICVYPPESTNYKPAFIYDLTTLNIPQKSIRSVKLGCSGKRKFVATAFEANNRVGFSSAKISKDGIHGSNHL